MTQAGHFRLAHAIGHRGLAAEAPQNSLTGLAVAAQKGFKWCEIDTQSSADEVAVVHHDFTLPGDGGINLAQMTGAELAATAVGDNPATGGLELLPTLHQAMELAAQLGLGLVVEIKSKPGGKRAEIDALAAVSVLRGRLLSLPLIVSSFVPEVIEHVARELPDIPLAANVVGLPDELPQGINNIHFDASCANAQQVASVKAGGYGIYAYTVNNAQQGRRLLDMGVDGLFTDTSELLGG